MSRTNPNVIVLTSGISGSSVLTGLISRAGYWTGDTTFKKADYDTYENQELISLNLRLVEQSGHTGNYAMDFSSVAIERIAALSGTIDDRPFRDFLQRCEGRQPWVWKDPRLWLTIRFWKSLLPLNNCKFILLTRSLAHSWVSSNLRRHVRSYGSLKRYELSIKNSLAAFLDSLGAAYLQMTYEELIVHPESVIGKLNTYLGTALTVDDLRAIYRGRLHRTPRGSPIDFVKSVLIYLKNYSERYDLIEKGKRNPAHAGPSQGQVTERPGP